MAAFSLLHPIMPDSLEAIRLQKEMEMDIGFRLKHKAISEMIPRLIDARLKGGSRLQMSQLLREYFVEFSSRYLKFGPGYFPTSFNVAEAFMSFNRSFFLFDLRDEIEHLLSIDDYFPWYQKIDFPLDTKILIDAMKEGCVYSYDMISGQGVSRILGLTKKVIAGISLVRHQHELSCVMLAGENPPSISSKEAEEIRRDGTVNPLKRGLVAHPDLSEKDRYLQGYDKYGKIIMLTRFDLRDGKHDVRYVNLDLGTSYAILTDDPIVYEGLPSKKIEKVKRHTKKELARYNELFAAMASLIYLPIFFCLNSDRIENLRVSTDLDVMRDDEQVKKLLSRLEAKECVLTRVISCCRIVEEQAGDSRCEIKPPEMKFKSEGYWRPIGPLEIGEGQEGERIFGKTWVTRNESWAAQSPQSFLIERSEAKVTGPDPGIIYVQRSPSHENGLYKIGLTRRDAATRAAELSSSTGVPIPFSVLASWNVGDCGIIEKTIHSELAVYRVNPRREFFAAKISHILRVIDGIVREHLRTSRRL